ncbi:quaternary amine ABC transporter ATP-binding protein [Halostreptopolyspora alba]|uniref:ATP-binding cassette domain-containing protein n=1 Tax=Halostreptopolyspora alba TaxID=2487137 RepID=A0A3N0E4G2_9ACTN|nr:ATP-binding cassette domain-containing protein [Nocardiopsaceae bacterium YIM 96095]
MTEEETVPAVRADRLYKVFGKEGPRAVDLLSDGRHRDEISELNVTAAVIDVTFDVEPGEIFVVMGLSGSGKSTLIRMLNGLLEPTSGVVEIDGTDITTLPSNQLRRLRSQHVSMVFQHFALFPHRTVLENAAYGLEVSKTPRAERREKAYHALGLVGLEGWENHVPEQLSGGMKQRVGLARALTAETDIILMDEAFSALDPLIRRDMQTQLLELQASLGKTVVFITHDLNEAMLLGDRICMLRDGRVAQIGTAEEILNAPADSYVANFVEDVDRSRVLTAASVMLPPSEGLDSSVAPVHPDTTLANLFHRASRSPAPLPVVDDSGRLVGELDGSALLAALAPNGGEAGGAGVSGTGTTVTAEPGRPVSKEGGRP